MDKKQAQLLRDIHGGVDVYDGVIATELRDLHKQHPEYLRICGAGDPPADGYGICQPYFGAHSTRAGMDAADIVLVDEGFDPKLKDKPMRVLEALTPGGSEFFNDAKRCWTYVKAKMLQKDQTIRRQQRELKELRKEIAELKDDRPVLTED